MADCHDNYVLKADGDNALANIQDSVIYDDGTNVGIGTTSPGIIASYDASSKKVLNVYNSSDQARLVSQGNPGILDVVDLGGGADDKHMNFMVNDGIAKFGSLKDDSSAWVQDNIIVMDLGNGNVGIGTTSPSYHLHEEKDSAANTQGASFLNVGLGDGNLHEVFVGKAASYHQLIALGYVHDTNEADRYGFLRLYGHSTEGVYIRQSGNVGIATSSPGLKLSVDGDAETLDGHYMKTDKVRARDGDGLYLVDDGDNGIFIEDGGNVGIGTTEPNDVLDVNGDIRVRGADIKDEGGTSRITLTKFGRVDLKRDNGSEVLSIATNGYVGIRTTTPNDALDVNGDIRVRGVNIKDYAGNTRIAFAEDGRLHLKKANGTNVLCVTEGPYGEGCVGIGTTNPGSKLQVNGAITPSSVPSRSGATIDVSDTNVVIVTDTTDITSLDNGVAGQMVVLIGDDTDDSRDVKDTGNIEVDEGTSRRLSRADNITLIYDGSSWLETSYSTPVTP